MRERKSEGVAAVLSFVFTGLKQIYNGQIGKGIIFVVFGIILAFTIIFLVGLVLYPLFWIYNIYNAYNTTNKINAGMPLSYGIYLDFLLGNIPACMMQLKTMLEALVKCYYTDYTLYYVNRCVCVRGTNPSLWS